MLSTVSRLPTILAALLLALNACADPGEARPTQTTVQTPTQTSGQTAGQTAQPTRDPHSGLRYIRASDLPREAPAVLTQIARGGPFRYERDGVTFGNREGILPRQPRGTYREYTVPTPGSRDRGARRIVCAGASRSTDECYYTADHYASFRRIQP